MKPYGFSLIEVLIALFIISTSCLVLLKQQWQAMLWSNQQLLTWQGNHHLISACECLKAQLQPPLLPAPFHWQSSENLHIKWNFHQQILEGRFNCSQPIGK